MTTRTVPTELTPAQRQAFEEAVERYGKSFFANPDLEDAAGGRLFRSGRMRDGIRGHMQRRMGCCQHELRRGIALRCGVRPGWTGQDT